MRKSGIDPAMVKRTCHFFTTPNKREIWLHVDDMVKKIVRRLKSVIKPFTSSRRATSLDLSSVNNSSL
ncbi:hypothetical protein V6N12_036710 [Hibiscus sabdariffa]|uniref:Uncharacterized protein n=1 Tax=Hibiscus sabdariffa TaxID=183260 RepID=A0ABR2ERV1_9ROSI